MEKLANISTFENLQATANAAMGIQSEMGVFNDSRNPLYTGPDPYKGAGYNHIKWWREYVDENGDKHHVGVSDYSVADWSGVEDPQPGNFKTRSTGTFDVFDKNISGGSVSQNVLTGVPSLEDAISKAKSYLKSKGATA